MVTPPRAGVLIGRVPAFSVRSPGQRQLTGARQVGDSNIALLLYSLGRQLRQVPTDDHPLDLVGAQRLEGAISHILSRHRIN